MSGAGSEPKRPSDEGSEPASVPEVPATEMLRKDDIRTGMSLAQTVYAVFMALGLKIAAEALYPTLFASGGSDSGTLSPVLVSFVFVILLLLAIRFSWVPRVLYEYVHRYIESQETLDKNKTFRSLMLYHFPVALVHTLLFFGICEAFAEITTSKSPTHAPVVHFVWICITLLAVNSVWLWAVTPSDSTGPGRQVWARNNFICALLAGSVLAAFYLAGFSVVLLLIVVLAILFLNSVFDLLQAADKYILFD